MLCVKNWSAQGKQPFGKPNGGKTGDFERFLPFFSSLLFSKKYRSIFQTIRNTVNCSTANLKTKPNCLKPFRMSRKNCLKSSAPQKSSWTASPSAKPLLPDSKLPCGWRQKRSMKRTTSKIMTAETSHRSAVFLYTLIAWLRLKNGKIYDIIRYRQIEIWRGECNEKYG